MPRIRPAIWILLTLAAASVAAAGPARAAMSSRGIQFAEVVVQQRVIIRVPVRPPPPAPRAMQFKESRGPRCILPGDVAGAAVVERGAVDFILRGQGRIRARFEHACPALDYYSGFYLKPGSDGRICAGRDSIHARSGGACEIDKLRVLKPRNDR